MKIKLVTSPVPKSGYRWDPERQEYACYKLDATVNGKRIRMAGFKSRKAANDFYDDLTRSKQYKRHGIKKMGKVPLKRLIDRRLSEIRDRKRLALEKRVLGYFLAITGTSAQVTDVTRQHLKTFNRKRAAEKKEDGETLITESTIDREMTVISALLKNAGEYFEELEDYAPPKIPRLKVPDSRRDRTVSVQEAERLIEHFARPRDKRESDGQYWDRLTIGHSFEFALYTSSRRKEVVKLQWSDYLEDQDTLYITRWKTRKSKADSITKFTPLPDRVRELLKVRRGMSPGDHVFSRHGEESFGYLKALKKACAKLGIPYGRFTPGGVIFHDTRHTFVSTLLVGGVDLETTRELSGLSRDMILRYAHSSPESKSRAIAVLNKRRPEGLRSIFDRVRDGEMDYPEFEASIFEFLAKNGQDGKVEGS